MPNRERPRIALVPGDPAGIGPELVAKLLSNPGTAAQADIVLVTDPEEFQRGLATAGVSVPYLEAASIDAADFGRGLPVLHPAGPARGWRRGEPSAEAGRYCLDTLRLALRLTRDGKTDAICFGPLNKTSLHLAGMGHADELHWFAAELDHHGVVSELNVLDRLWTSRVTSHVALKDVPGLLTAERVADAIVLLGAALRRAGRASPRIAVSGLNPHNGEHGAFGREESDIIAPGVALARRRGTPADGPFPADTIFLRARAGEYDAIVTMYHDQGQIAMKLMGFDRGVTVQGGLPVPITTPAHGTAFDIAGRGVANPGAMARALALACAMARTLT